MAATNHQAALEYDRLFYPELFQGWQEDLDALLESVHRSPIVKAEETIELRLRIWQRDHALLVETAKAMADTFARGAVLLAFGNGGSSTDAQDLAAELCHPSFPGWRPPPVLVLTHDVVAVTAIANDMGFDNIFVRQVIAFGRPGDIAFGISTSGNSANVLAGLVQAKRQGLLTIGLSGYDGGQMSGSSTLDYWITVDNEHIPRIQEGQATVYHILIALVQRVLAEAAVAHSVSAGI
ncbi:Phosphoheptose isomerase [Candidatus Hydrogenisulfobacillus filiaventi]|uniref:Phosphoheptose isomerase n=1 Tax=Candidatus Hydrogenisulfobacillus filiaventi TaxID=2707344 RepID=A0A6F8ZFN1_9FIRM|nr:Phosphoheptose isomerase [Candidatus Hydrogenisulfobacillus filiaventi]